MTTADEPLLTPHLPATPQALAHPARPVPEGNLSDLSHARVREHGHRPFLTFYDDATGERTELSYATFDNWVAKTANFLVEEIGVHRGQRVATVLGNHWTTVVITFACWRAGACVVPLDADDPLTQSRAVLGAARPAAAFVREELVTELDTLGHGSAFARVVAVGTGLGARLTTDAGPATPYAEEVLAFADDFDDPEVVQADDALLVFPPRAGDAPAPVRLTQGNLLAAADALVVWGLDGDDRLLCTQPVQLVDGLALAHLAPFLAGSSVVLTRQFDPADFWRKVADERVTTAILSPTNLDGLAQSEASQRSVEGLRAVICPTAASPDAAAGAEQALGLPLCQGHGLAEASCASSLTPAELDADTRRWLAEQHAVNVGVPTVHAQVSALAADGRPLAHGARGELAVRGPVVMAGYEGPAELDDAVFAHGWLHTGDEGYVDVGPDGREQVFVTGRIPARRRPSG
ncbi:MAG: TIGR03089 family protein [Actinomycetota bacterium]|nr:TIGR03089 family protein [Actinomycetota bacterium]